MVRPACISDPGVPLHLVQRSRGDDDGFAGGEDRIEYLARLRALAARHHCAVHAYVLMGNHVHLLATPAAAAAAPGLMRALGGAFDATPVHARRYVLACMRYIELNPVRAGLVRRPVDYRWSSFRANALGITDALVSPHPFYYALGRGPAERCAAYRALFISASRSPLSAARRAR